MGNIASPRGALLERVDKAIDLTEEPILDAHELLSEIRKIAVTGDCPVCFAPQNLPGGCLCQRADGTRVEWVRPAIQRIKRVAKQKAPFLAKFAVVVVLVAIVAMKMMSSGTPVEAQETQRAEAVRSALKDVAAAQEISSRQTGSYQYDAATLQHHGARTPSDITVRVVSADTDGYCLEGSAFGVEQVWRYSSYHAVIEPGRC
jgi:hypothetical protein